MSIETYAQDLGPDTLPYVIRGAGATGGVHREPRATVLPYWATFCAILAFWCDRARDLLPSVEHGAALRYVMAMQAHAAQGPTRETFAALLANMTETEPIRADDIARGAMFDRAVEYGYLDTDSELYRLNPVRTEAATTHRRHADGKVRGFRKAYVIGNNGDAGKVDQYGAAMSTDLVQRANLWLHASGESLSLIGSDEFSWEQFVDFQPVRIPLTGITYNGRPMGDLVIAPEGAGDSIVGAGDLGDPGKRKRKSYKVRRAQYATMPVQFACKAEPRCKGTCDCYERDDSVKRGDHGTRCDNEVTFGAWPTMSAYRVVKRYRTTFDGRHVIGHGTWQDNIRKARKATVSKPRQKALELPQEAATAAIRSAMVQGYETSTAAACRVKITGTDHKVSVTLEPTARRFRVEVTTGKARRCTTVRSVDAAVHAVERLLVS